MPLGQFSSQDPVSTSLFKSPSLSQSSDHSESNLVLGESSSAIHDDRLIQLLSSMQVLSFVFYLVLHVYDRS